MRDSLESPLFNRYIGDSLFPPASPNPIKFMRIEHLPSTSLNISIEVIVARYIYFEKRTNDSSIAP